LQPPESARSLVSVVVIGYNQQDLAPIAVTSVLKQTHSNLECIFVDDGSQDATFARAVGLMQTDPRLRAFTKANGGQSSARNFGAARISPDAQFIAFLDGDDVFRPDYIETCLDYLIQTPAAGVVVPSHDFVDPSGVPLEAQRRGYRWAPSHFWLLPRRLRDFERATPFVTFYCGTGVVPFWLARVDVYRNTAGWDEELRGVEDVDMLCQLAMVTEVHAIGAKLVDYRIHPEQVTNESSTTSRNRTPNGLSHVQEKWNKKRYHERQRNRTLDQACIYYRQVHLPFRALWVTRRAFFELLRSPSPRSLFRLVELLGYFLRDFLYFKIFFWRSTRRYAATRFYEANLSAPTGIGKC